MKKILMTLAAVLCCAMATMAQNTPEQMLKEAEAKAKLADKNPKNAKMQLAAAGAFIYDELGDKKDFDRALIYANRALKLSQEHPAPQDTLQGNTCLALGLIYMGKQDMETAVDFFQKATDGFQTELGRYDPVTIGTKFLYGWMMMQSQPFRGFPMIQEAMVDNSFAPNDKRIENMEEANIALEFALEMIIAEHTKRYRYAVPVIYIDSTMYYIVQTADWNLERPLVGWMVPSMLGADKSDDEVHDPAIIADDMGRFRVLSEEERKKSPLIFNFRHFVSNPKHIEYNKGDSRLLFLQPEGYNRLLSDYRKFKESLTK